MSVLIKNMEMPRSCDECELCTCYVREDGTEENYRCVITFYPIHKFDERHEYCPLVEIPPHGRLIDADALQKDIQKHADLFVNCGNLDLAAMAQRDGLSCALSDVVNAPTIIESTIGQLNSDPAVNEAEEGEC